MAADVRAEAFERGRPEHAAASSWLLGQCALSREDGPLAAGRSRLCLSELAQSDPEHPTVPAGDHPEPATGPDRRAPGALRRGDPAVGQAGRRHPGQRLRAVRHRLRGQAFGRPAVGDLRRHRAVEHFAELRDDLARAQALHQLGCIQRDCGNHRRPLRPCPWPGTSGSASATGAGELLTEINIALLRAMAGDIDRGLTDARRCLSGFESAGDQVGMGATLTILGAVELVSGETRAAREMYAQGSGKARPWRRHAGWQRLMVAELSNELATRIGRPGRLTGPRRFSIDELRHRRSAAGRAAWAGPG